MIFARKLFIVYASRLREYCVINMERKKEENPYTNISIKKQLYDDITAFIKNQGRYRSPTQFIEEAARLRLEELEKED